LPVRQSHGTTKNVCAPTPMVGDINATGLPFYLRVTATTKSDQSHSTVKSSHSSTQSRF